MTRSLFRHALIRLLLVCTGSLPSLMYASDLVVFEFELKDLTLAPLVEFEATRVASMRPLLVDKLKTVHELRVVDTPPSAAIEAGKGVGYLFDRPAVAARIAREAGADFAVSGRLHKASHLFVYAMAQLIDAKTERIAADFVVEMKGPQDKFTDKGMESLALQINDALHTLNSR